MRSTTWLSCILLAGSASVLWTAPAAMADDDWEDYLEDLEDAREEAKDRWEDYYDDLEDAREEEQDRWDDYYDDGGYSYRYGYGASGYDRYAAEPYWSYPPEYSIFSGHPSRYYYTYPDRYYSQRYRYDYPNRYRSYGYQSNPNIWRNDIYGYQQPYGRQYRSDSHYRNRYGNDGRYDNRYYRNYNRYRR